MQVFVPYSEPILVAQCLDAKRLNKQIIECKQILDAIEGKGKGWFNHPITKMYANHRRWLKFYMKCLTAYKLGFLRDATYYSNTANALCPTFLTEEFCDQHKRRLYTKNPDFYKEFEKYGTSEENWYFIENEIVKYINGKKL